MKKHDRVSGVIWFVLGISMCIGSIKLNLGSFHEPGAGFMPFLSGAFLGLFGLILIFSSTLRGLWEKEHLKDKKIQVEKPVEKNWKNLMFVLLILFGYPLLLDTLGFYLTTFLFLFFLFKLKEPKRWLMPLIFSISVVILSYLIFELCLNCRFPRGIFRSL